MDAVGGAKPGVVWRGCRGLRQAPSWQGICSPSSPGTAQPRERGWQPGTGDNLLTLLLLGAFDEGPFVDTVHFFSDGDTRPDDNDLFPIRAGPRRTVPLAVTRPAGHLHRSSQRGNEAEHGQSHANRLPELTQHRVSLHLCGWVDPEIAGRRGPAVEVLYQNGDPGAMGLQCNMYHCYPAAPRTSISTQLLIRRHM